jgi:hypothetical protein
MHEMTGVHLMKSSVNVQELILALLVLSVLLSWLLAGGH